MSRWKTWGASAGLVLILGGALALKSCGYGEEHASGPGADQVEWMDKITTTLDGFPSDCSAVGPSCSGFIDAAATVMSGLDGAVSFWDDGDKYQAVHKDVTDAQDASDQWDLLNCTFMPYSDWNSSKCASLVHQSLDALNDANDLLAHGGTSS